jgi:S-adenosylmethionine hydrolase
MSSGEPWRPSGVVSLLTDFGLDDPYVGQMKAVLLARSANARIVDLAHGVPPQDVRVAAFFLERSARHFPPGTVHVCVVDPGVGSARRLLVARDAGQAFLAPDNGLLPAALSSHATWRELDVERFALPGASRTFHGRDVLAPAAAALAEGTAPEDAGRELAPPPVRLPAVARRTEPGRVEARVLFADRYGNLVLDLGPEALEGPLSAWRAEAGGRALPFAGTYAEVRSGELCALVDSFGAIELAARDGSAAEALDLCAGDPVLLRRIA